MGLVKKVSADRIEVLENGSVQVRTKTAITKDGAAISNTFSRYVVAPGDDYSSQDAKVQAICAVVHTTEVIAAYKAAQATQIPA